MKCNFQVTTIKNGGYFGELALVTHKPRAATVTANGDIRVACKQKCFFYIGTLTFQIEDTA